MRVGLFGSQASRPPWRPTRRDALRTLLGGAAAALSPWFGNLARAAASDPRRKRACILLWMPGGPSQTDTFDLKPGHENGGPFKEIETSVPGIRISEHLPQTAKWMEHLALVRSMSTKEGDHTRATYFLRTGYVPGGPVNYPPLGAALGKQLGEPDADLPNYVSILPQSGLNPAAYGSGFLGPRHAPLVVEGRGEKLEVENLKLGVDTQQLSGRLSLLAGLEQSFRATHPDPSVESHETAYRQAVRMLGPEAAAAFDLSTEPQALKDSYGRNLFGQGCMLARRLVERGVPFVEVSLMGERQQAFGWDTHLQNFDIVKQHCSVLDPAWAALMQDLKSRGLLETTTIVWMGEFGRTPKINKQLGRDHFPAAWTAVLGGGGVRGGQVIGRTSRDGMAVEDRPVTTADLLATLCGALGVDRMGQNMSNVGRPIRLVNPEAHPIQEIIA